MLPCGVPACSIGRTIDAFRSPGGGGAAVAATYGGRDGRTHHPAGITHQRKDLDHSWARHPAGRSSNSRKRRQKGNTTMETTEQNTLVLRDSAGSYYLVPQATVEQGRVPAEQQAEIEQLIADRRGSRRRSTRTRTVGRGDPAPIRPSGRRAPAAVSILSVLLSSPSWSSAPSSRPDREATPPLRARHRCTSDDG
jgi:hypothetical protein